MRSHSFPKCQTTMTEGFVAAEKHGMPIVSSGVEDVPLSGWWGDVKLPDKLIQIATWRS